MLRELVQRGEVDGEHAKKMLSEVIEGKRNIDDVIKTLKARATLF